MRVRLKFSLCTTLTDIVVTLLVIDRNSAGVGNVSLNSIMSENYILFLEGPVLNKGCDMNEHSIFCLLVF